MSEIIWRNARLATFSPGNPQPYGMLDRHAIAVRDGVINAVIPEADLGDTAAQQVDLGGRLVTPGLIDCHTHLVFAGSRAQEWEQRLNGVSYQQISAAGGGINATVQATRRASEETLLGLAQARLDRLMREGVTTVEIKSGYGLDLASEGKMLRVARRLGERNRIDVSPTLLAAHAVPGEYRDRADDYIELVCSEILPRAVGGGAV
ncbi:Imidazolonepropionase [Pluralibacter gergoviae]|nr:Imidazolonepropionase [Pluralibacter gergoviae]